MFLRAGMWESVPLAFRILRLRDLLTYFFTGEVFLLLAPLKCPSHVRIFVRDEAERTSTRTFEIPNSPWKE